MQGLNHLFPAQKTHSRDKERAELLKAHTSLDSVQAQLETEKQEYAKEVVRLTEENTDIRRAFRRLLQSVVHNRTPLFQDTSLSGHLSFRTPFFQDTSLSGRLSFRTPFFTISRIVFWVTFCRQKVTLWQHADELEQEQQQMGKWINSKTVTACMECTVTFSLRVRKVTTHTHTHTHQPPSPPLPPSLPPNSIIVARVAKYVVPSVVNRRHNYHSASIYINLHFNINI